MVRIVLLYIMVKTGIKLAIVLLFRLVLLYFIILEYPVKKAPRFLFMETMAAIMAGMWTSMMATAGYLSLSAFEASYDLNCIACKCYDNCALYKDLGISFF